MQTKDTRILAYKALVLDMVKQFEDVKFINVLREVNSKVDQLVVEAS